MRLVQRRAGPGCARAPRVPPVGVEPTPGALLRGLPLPLGHGGSRPARYAGPRVHRTGAGPRASLPSHSGGAPAPARPRDVPRGAARARGPRADAVRRPLRRRRPGRPHRRRAAGPGAQRLGLRRRRDVRRLLPDVAARRAGAVDAGRPLPAAPHDGRLRPRPRRARGPARAAGHPAVGGLRGAGSRRPAGPALRRGAQRGARGRAGGRAVRRGERAGQRRRPGGAGDRLRRSAARLVALVGVRGRAAGRRRDLRGVRGAARHAAACTRRPAR